MTVDENFSKMKLKSDKYISDGGRHITDKDYENNLRQKLISMGLYTITTCYGRNQQSFQAIICYNYPGVKILNRQSVIINGEIIKKFVHIAQLIVNHLEAKPHARNYWK